MKESREKTDKWLDKATAAIRFGPDRRTVRSELSAHLEDKALDFQRIFPGLTEAEARERAAAEMGDPEEIGKKLARIHKPWLGWLWQFSRFLALAALLLLAVEAAIVLPVAWDPSFRNGISHKNNPFVFLCRLWKCSIFFWNMHFFTFFL